MGSWEGVRELTPDSSSRPSLPAQRDSPEMLFAPPEAWRWVGYVLKLHNDDPFYLLLPSSAIMSRPFDRYMFEKCIFISQVIASLYVLVTINYTVIP